VPSAPPEIIPARESKPSKPPNGRLFSGRAAKGGKKGATVEPPLLSAKEPLPQGSPIAFLAVEPKGRSFAAGAGNGISGAGISSMDESVISGTWWRVPVAPAVPTAVMVGAVASAAATEGGTKGRGSAKEAEDAVESSAENAKDIESAESATSNASSNGATPKEPGGLDTKEVLEALMRAAGLVAPVLQAHLWLFDEATDTLRPLDSVGPGVAQTIPVTASTGALGRAVSSGVPAVGTYDEMPGGQPGVSQYAIPIVARDTAGVAALDLLTSSPDDTRLAEVAAGLDNALAAALALDVTNDESSSAALLLRAASEIVHLVDPQAIIEATLDKALEVAKSDTGSVMLTCPDGAMRIRASRGLPEEVIEQAAIRSGDGIAGVVLATGKSLVIENLNGKGPASRRHEVISAITVPITDDLGPLGVLNVGSRKFHARRSAKLTSALEALGKVTAVSLRNAHEFAASSDRHMETVRALALAFEKTDPYSLGSTDRVHELTQRLTEALGLPYEERQATAMAALLHDIGMPATSDFVSAKERPLTTIEQGLLKMHPTVAADVLGQTSALVSAVPIVYHHHEHYDSSGYVLGLSGSDIPMGSRVLAVTDAYVSMTSSRPYRNAMAPVDAIAEIQGKAGSQFDPEVVDAFVGIVNQA